MQSPSQERYEIIEELGRGGMGAVFLARDRLLRREVALKVAFDGSSDEMAAERFVKEARATASLSHPTLIPTYTISRIGGDLFFTMRVVRGQTLREVMSDPRISLHRLVRALIDLCRGVDYAHRQGVVHRDLKPDNVMIDPEGRVAILDWGLVGARATGDGADLLALGPGSSRLTVTGSLMGTPAYMAPEQAQGEVERIGPHSDIYAVGAILYEALAKTCSREGTMYEVLLELQEGRPVEPPSARSGAEIPPELEAICLTAMNIRPRDRYASAGALADDLDAWSAGQNVSVFVPPWPVRVSRWIARHRLVSAALAMCLVLGGLLFGIWDTRRRLEVEADEARAARETEQLHHRLDADHRVAAAAYAKAEVAFGNLRRSHLDWRKAVVTEDRILADIPALPPLLARETLVDYESRLGQVMAAVAWARIRDVVAIRRGTARPAGCSTVLADRLTGIRDRWYFQYDQSRRFYRRILADSRASAWVPTVDPSPQAGLAGLAAMRLEIELDQAMAQEADSPGIGRVRSLLGVPLAEAPRAWRGTLVTLAELRGLDVSAAPRAAHTAARAEALLEGRTPVRIAAPPSDWEGRLSRATGEPLWARNTEDGGLVEEPLAGLVKVRDLPREPLLTSLVPGEYLVVLRRGAEEVRAPFLVERGKPAIVRLDLPPKIPEGVAFVPGGEVIDGGVGHQAFPRHRAGPVSSFFIHTTEVSFRQFGMFLVHLIRTGEADLLEECMPRVGTQAGSAALVERQGDQLVLSSKVRWLKWDMPVFGVSYVAASAYARWLGASRPDGWIWRLPTSREWALAAGGPSGRRYPWGSRFDPARVRSEEGREGGYSSPVASYPYGRSIYGVHHLSGNVWEFVSTPFSENWITQRGGSFGCTSLQATIASRDGNHMRHVGADDGFRLVLVPMRSGR